MVAKQPASPHRAEAGLLSLMDSPQHCPDMLHLIPRVFIASTRAEERFALNLLLHDLELGVVGEAADWPTTLAQVPASGANVLLVDWDILPSPSGAALDVLRESCPLTLSIVLISRLDARQQAAVSSGADLFVSKGEPAENVAAHFRTFAAGLHPRAPVH